jgi:hemerythrin
MDMKNNRRPARANARSPSTAPPVQRSAPDLVDALELQRATMVRLVHWYLAGVRSNISLAQQRRLLQQVCTSIRFGFSVEEEAMRALQHPGLAQRLLVHRHILDGLEKLLRSRRKEEVEGRFKMLHALDELVVLQLASEPYPSASAAASSDAALAASPPMPGAPSPLWRGEEALRFPRARVAASRKKKNPGPGDETV